MSEKGEPFGLIEARSNARWWMLPLSSRSQARTGLGLFHPVSPFARASKFGGSLACAFGLQRLVFRTKLRLTGFNKLLDLFPGSIASSMAIFTGTDGPHRKTTIQFADCDAKILGYGKLSRSQRVIPWIENEARILNTLSELCLKTVDVPSALSLQKSRKSCLLITDSQKSRQSEMPRELKQAHVDFLKEISARTKRDDWSDQINVMRQRYSKVHSVMSANCSASVAAALDRLAAGPPLPSVLAHGDFTPWNSFSGRRLYVFDWEYAERRTIGYDTVHFAFATRLTQEASKLQNTAITALNSVHPELDVLMTRSALLAYLCNHTLFFAIRELEGQGRIDGWTDSLKMLELIQQLLVA